MIRVSDCGEDTSIAEATGFVWESKGKWYLVTNLHNLTGWNFVEKKSLSPVGACPTHLDIYFGAYYPSDPKNALSSGGFLYGRRGFRLALTDENGPLWLVHPLHGEEVDVATLEICLTPDSDNIASLGIVKFSTIPANMHDWVNFAPAAGDDAFVLGYPRGMNSKGLPIWKRASIATEPDIDVDDLPKILIDTATRQGMSGSPVIVVRKGLTNPSGSFADDSILGESMNFLGVYSGRIGEDPLGVQLGVVWKSAVIDEIIDGERNGKFPWDS